MVGFVIRSGGVAGLRAEPFQFAASLLFFGLRE